MKVLYATYPMAFHTPGGGEVQLLAYQNVVVQTYWRKKISISVRTLFAIRCAD